jgi:hypothetical protein
MLRPRKSPGSTKKSTRIGTVKEKVKVKVNAAKVKVTVKAKVLVLVPRVFPDLSGIARKVAKVAKANTVAPILETPTSTTSTSTSPLLITHPAIGQNMTTTQPLLPSLLRKPRS